jgi:hypothetical protein
MFRINHDIEIGEAGDFRVNTRTALDLTTHTKAGPRTALARKISRLAPES